MRHVYVFLLLLLLSSAAHPLHAQQPFERFGVKVKVLTLSNGKYPEFFPNDSLRRLGSVVYDTRRKRVAALLPPDSLRGLPSAQVPSRWLSPDPLAEKYAYESPYNYVANNPVNYTDPDGRQIDYRQTSQHTNKKTGVTTVNIAIDVTMKVMNNSQMTQKEFNAKVAEFRTELTGALSGKHTSGKVNYVFTAGKVDVQVASDMKSVSSSDHLMVFVDDVTGKSDKGGPAAGVGPFNERISYVEGSEGVGSMIHEFGHNIGLQHNWRTPSKADDSAKNYMGYGSNKSSLAGEQLYDSYQIYKENLLNQGSNYSTLSMPGYYTPSTTQSKPYRQAKQGQKIPRPLYSAD